MLIRRAAAPIALLAAVALAGCTAPEPEPMPTVAPTEAPLFASEEEALAAAEAVYSAYLGQLDLVLQRGGEYSDELDEYASPDVARVHTAGFEEYRDNQWRSTGATTFDSVSLQSFNNDASPGAEVIAIYACNDLSKTDVLDASGTSVVTAERDTRLEFEIGFEIDQTGALIVAREEQWPGSPFC